MRTQELLEAIETGNFSERDIAMITFVALARCAEYGRGAWEELTQGIQNSDDADRDEIMANIEELAGTIQTPYK